MSSSSFGVANGGRGARLDLTGSSGGPVPLGDRHGSCLWSVIMPGSARHREGWLAVSLMLAVALLVTFFVLALAGAAWPAVGGGHGGGHSGGFGGGHPGGGRPGGGFPRGREFGGDRHGHEHEHGGPRVFVFPYFYDPYYGYDPYYPGYPYAAYCDPYSAYYAPQYCYWDGP